MSNSIIKLVWVRWLNSCGIGRICHRIFGKNDLIDLHNSLSKFFSISLVTKPFLKSYQNIVNEFYKPFSERLYQIILVKFEVPFSDISSRSYLTVYCTILEHMFFCKICLLITKHNITDNVYIRLRMYNILHRNINLHIKSNMWC